MHKIQFLLKFTFLLLTLVPAVAAEKFECTSPFSPSSPATLEQVTGLLPNANAMVDVGLLNTAISTLRRDGLSKVLIIDHFIGAYCTMIAGEAGLTDSEKTSLVQRFSGQATRLVYSLESGLDIIINVPLTPAVVDAVNIIAKRQGLSGPAWIEMTMDNALQQQRTARRQ
ncbi:hypothetical protein [Bradyrhizobium sp. LA7.1]|uniref:hypothetical protein n=1 Tax=Bradyrhizobium sp. LA7.1 TaxID=3156324 RepID=UPI0033944B1D